MGRRDWRKNCDVMRKCGGDSLREKKVKGFERKMMINQGFSLTGEFEGEREIFEP